MENDMVHYPVDGTLDLHMFQPNEVKSVLSEYLQQCRIQGVMQVRIIHGKGQGVLSRIVHSFLKNCPYVREFRTPFDASGWGATIAVLDPVEKKRES